MAESLDDGGFLLPPEFLPDDIFVADKNQVAETKGDDEDGVCFPSDFPYDHESRMSSPVGSTTETESDEEYTEGLARRMAHSFLYDDDDKSNSPAFKIDDKQRSTACLPQFPMFTTTGCPSKVVSPSRNVSSPDTTCDMLYAAAGRLLTLRQQAEAEQQRLCGVTAVGNRLGDLGIPRKATSPFSAGNAGYMSNSHLTHHQLQITQFYQLKHQQMLRQLRQGSAAWERQHRGRDGVGTCANNGRAGRPLGVPSSTGWATLQQSHGSGMRALFLGTPGSRRQSCGGTGVFLPRMVGTPAESPKKPACSTVLLPARVVQALNLNLEEVGAEPHFPGGFILDHEKMLAQKKSSSSGSLRSQHTAGVNHHEIRLPQEWTY